MYDNVRQRNFTTKPRFLKWKLQISSWTNSQSREVEKISLVKIAGRWQRFEKKFSQTRLGGEFWARDVLMHKAQSVIIISTSVVFLRKWRHFLQFSAKTWNKENFKMKAMILGNKGKKKTWVLMFVIELNLPRCLGKTYCVRRCEKWASRIDHIYI